MCSANVKSYWSMEVFRNTIYFMNVNVLGIVWSWTWRMIIALKMLNPKYTLLKNMLPGPLTMEIMVDESSKLIDWSLNKIAHILLTTSHFMCHHELWPTSVGHPFPFPNSCWGFTGGIHYWKIIIAIFRFVHQNFTIPGYFPYILFYSLFSLLSSGWFVIAVCGSVSVQGTS